MSDLFNRTGWGEREHSQRRRILIGFVVELVGWFSDVR